MTQIVTQILCGIDVSSTTLDAFVRPSGLVGRFTNNPDGIDALARFCREHGVNQQRLITEPVVQATFDDLLHLLKRQIDGLAGADRPKSQRRSKLKQIPSPLDKQDSR